MPCMLWVAESLTDLLKQDMGSHVSKLEQMKYDGHFSNAGRTEGITQYLCREDGLVAKVNGVFVLKDDAWVPASLGKKRIAPHFVMGKLTPLQSAVGRAGEGEKVERVHSGFAVFVDNHPHYPREKLPDGKWVGGAYFSTWDPIDTAYHLESFNHPGKKVDEVGGTIQMQSGREKLGVIVLTADGNSVPGTFQCYAGVFPGAGLVNPPFILYQKLKA